MNHSEVIELLKEYGHTIGDQAREGDKVAKAVMDAYGIYYRRQEPCALALVECTFELWMEKNLAKG